MSTFSRLITQHWNIPATRGDVLADLPGLSLVVDPSLGENRRAWQLVDAEGRHHIAVRPDVAELAGLVGREFTDPDAVVTALEAVGEAFHDWEQVFYLGEHSRAAVAAEPAHPQVRQLTDADAAAFAAFEAANTAEDIDEAYVELDHWLVVGMEDPDEAATNPGTIVCASSVYPWDGSQLADIGIITAPSHRGRGLARAVVRAAARATIERGFEPQYRCQVSNVASRATGERAGFELFGTWRANTGEPPEDAACAVH